MCVFLIIIIFLQVYFIKLIVLKDFPENPYSVLEYQGFRPFVTKIFMATLNFSFSNIYYNIKQNFHKWYKVFITLYHFYKLKSLFFVLSRYSISATYN